MRIDPRLENALEERAQAISETLGSSRIGAMFATQMRDTLERTLTIETPNTTSPGADILHSTEISHGAVPQGASSPGAEDPASHLSTFVITGDIPAMWLRDSSAQLRPFLRFAREHQPLSDAIAGLLRRQFALIEHDPYANAFNQNPNGNSWHAGDLNPDPLVWERKDEIDSLAFPVQLAGQLYRATGRTDFLDASAWRAFALIVDTWSIEQDHEARSPYRFVRDVGIPTETLERQGRGSPVGWTGMTWSGFRPSDDACTYHYNIPGNLFAVLALQEMVALIDVTQGEPGSQSQELDAGEIDLSELRARALALSEQITQGVYRFGTVDHPKFGRIFAYEVDGLGHQVLMDDANMPSLLSLPLTSPVAALDPLYQNTRAMVLSQANPYFYQGSRAAGIGSPHTPPHYIWPIALAVQGLTAADRAEQVRLAHLLADNDGGTGLMHEGFSSEDTTQFTRPWFSWANSMFCELLLDIASQESPSEKADA